MVKSINVRSAYCAWLISTVFAFAVPSYGQTEANTASAIASEEVPSAQLAPEVPGNPHTIVLNELAGFDVLPDSGDTSAMLTDGSFENGDPERQPTLLIISSDSETKGDIPEDKELFAAVMLYATEDLFKKVKLKDTRNMTVAGLPAAEVLAKAKGIKTGEKLKLVQWMAFSKDGRFIRIIGYAPKDQFEDALPRFEKVRDGMVIGP